jgi:Trypsin-like peptidase domain
VPRSSKPTTCSRSLTASGNEYDLQLDPNQTFSGGFQINGNNITLLPNNGPAGSTAPVIDNNSNIYPYNCVCYIVIQSPTGDKTATGFIIGPHTILTAAHVVAGVPTNGALNSSLVIYAIGHPEEIPGRYQIASENPNGARGPSYSQSDFAIITVAADLGAQAFSLPNGPASTFSGGTVNVTGYPGSVPGYTFAPPVPFNDIGTVTPDPEGYAALDWDTLTDPNSLVDYPGESGGPLWTMSKSLPSENPATAWGIVSGGQNDEDFGTTGYNVQLTPTDVGTIKQWEVVANATLGLRAVSDFTGSGTSDILFRNNVSGDTWFEAMSNGAFDGWQQIGGSNTSYAAVGVGDFFGDGTDDILFRNNSTGDTWIETISNGAFASWNQIGGSNTNYSVVGVGDFIGEGWDSVMFRNSSTGDTWIEVMNNGSFLGWSEISGSNTSYAVVGVGDFYGNGTDELLFRSNRSSSKKGNLSCPPRICGIGAVLSRQNCR